MHTRVIYDSFYGHTKRNDDKVCRPNDIKQYPLTPSLQSSLDGFGRRGSFDEYFIEKYYYEKKIDRSLNGKYFQITTSTAPFN